jgi:integrase
VSVGRPSVLENALYPTWPLSEWSSVNLSTVGCWTRLARSDRNPFDALPTIKRAPKRVYDLFTEPEITALCGLEIRDGALFQILFDAGPRKGDCRAFQLQHFRPEPTLDAPYGRLVFHEGKGGKDRQVPATQQVAAKVNELAILDGLKRTDHLWYARPANAVGYRITRTRPVGEGTFARWWRRCLDEAGVRYRNPHMTRHTFATRYLRGLGDKPGRLETLQLVLGHESIRTTSDLYGHLDMADVALDMGLVG